VTRCLSEEGRAALPLLPPYQLATADDEPARHQTSSRPWPPTQLDLPPNADSDELRRPGTRQPLGQNVADPGVAPNALLLTQRLNQHEHAGLYND
jgi:hypothetical protein